MSANLHGWTTRTFADLRLIQHKPTGGADGAWRNAFKNGRANYLTGYHPAFMVAKCVKRSIERPLIVGSIALLSGYISGYLRGIPQAADPRAFAICGSSRCEGCSTARVFMHGDNHTDNGASMKLSIVIICWNDLKVIKDCLESIYRETAGIPL